MEEKEKSSFARLYQKNATLDLCPGKGLIYSVRRKIVRIEMRSLITLLVALIQKTAVQLLRKGFTVGNSSTVLFRVEGFIH